MGSGVSSERGRRVHHCRPFLGYGRVKGRIRKGKAIRPGWSLLELRRSDVDGVTGRIDVTRKVDKDAYPAAAVHVPSAAARSAHRRRSGTRTVHVPPPFLPLLQKHLLEHTAAGPTGLLFPGDRTDHMSVRYLMDRYRPAREAAGRPDLTIHHLRRVRVSSRVSSST